MSGKKTAVKARPVVDRRSRRTRDALGDALVGLMQERPFKSITVQEVLDRAEVGRSTFYTHYRDKDDLFLSDVEDFWEMMSSMLERSGEKSNRVAPVRELFANVAEAKSFRESLAASGKVHDVMELGQGHFAGALFSSLTWWIDRRMPVSAAEMDDAFHRLVWSGVNASQESAVKSANR